MKIGFSILSHKTPDKIYTALIDQLSRYPDHAIAIHHDRSKSAFDTSLFKEKTVNLVENIVETSWSHVNNIEALLRTFEILYDKKCDWYVTLSANCYPAKAPQQLIDFLTNADYDGYIECNDVTTDHFDFYKFFRKAFDTYVMFKIPFIKRNGTFYMKPIRIRRKVSDVPFTNSFIPFHGSDWFMINRKSMEYILNNRKRIQQLVDFFKKVNHSPDLNVCPPEVVFQTILANNKELKLNNNNYRFIDWTNAVNWHPNILTEKDFKDIQKTEAFFLRKVDEASSLELVKQINTSLL